VFGRSVPQERASHPFTGFKLAHAVLSADGRRAGFAGLSIGACRVYGVTAEASCVWNLRHAPPKRRCGCGFYCFSTLAGASALACATGNRAAVLLEVVASGRFIRYERGLRYSRQRVRAVQVSPCPCGRAAIGLVDGGSGVVGWRCLAAVCAVCVVDRPYLTFGEFVACLDEPVGVGAGTVGVGAGSGAGARMTPSVVSPAEPGPSSIVVLTAEIELMQARLDDLQARVARYYGPRQ
jgi:hypothetical protein